MLDLQPALLAVRTMHPRARGAIVVLHDEDGQYHVNCASFEPSKEIEAHEAEMRTLVVDGPTVARKWRESIIAASKAGAR